MKTTRRRTRSESEAGLAGAPGVDRARDVRDGMTAATVADGAAAGPRPDGERLRRFFIVSVSEDAGGELHGVVEAVRSGRKERFQRLDALGPVVGAMFRRLRDDETGRVT